MTFVDPLSNTLPSTDSFPLSSALGLRPRPGSRQLGERLTRSVDITFSAAVGESSRRSFLIVATAVLVHRYTGLDRVSIEVLDGTGKVSVVVSGDESTSRLLENLTLSPAAGPPPDLTLGAIAVSFTGNPEGPGSVGNFEAGCEMVVHADVAASRAEISLDGSRFDNAFADRISGHLEVLLGRMAKALCDPVGRLDILTDREADTLLLEWNGTDRRLTDDVCIHQAFEARAAATPEAVAAVFGEESWLFGRVNSQANELAHRLIDLGVGPDVRVAVHLERTPDLLVTLLAVLKAGGAYVPLDPRYPRARLESMILGTDCSIMISSRSLAEALPVRVRHRLLIDELSGQPGIRQENPVTEVGPENLCYVIHTSGSTGTPKPIALRHRGVLNNLVDLNTRFDIGPDDAVLALSSPGFDMSVYEFLGITLAGGTVVIPEPDAGHHPASWLELVHRHRVTVWNSAPPLMDLFLDFVEVAGDRRPLPVELSLTGGDWVAASMPARFRKAAPRLKFVALGGATEASIHSTAFEADPSAPWDGGHLPYGRPLANQRTFILDDRMMPVPVGVAGELCLGGAGLGRGYLDRPDETREKFVSWSYRDRPEERLYRTGDMARFSCDGLIEILGRRDFQVKINGIRVELGDVESALAAHPGVKRAVVVPRAAPHGRAALVGYVTAQHLEVLDGTSILQELRERLPEHMVPASVEIMDALPLNGNGKIDRRALASLRSPGAPPSRARVRQSAPPGSWQQLVVEAWRDVLGADQLDDHDDFFAKGGDSMKAIRAMVRIDPRLRVSDIYRHRTAVALADHLTERYGERPAPSS
ncbi:amino acid adenylation domain-containing protein [Pseudonocardia sp. ICBG162]|uniref:non-ribosomal peptide synthetase n=1 Tax=Pseudonocardia sp. ICBG162 TaxID=2846761 RepID=UPI001CF6AF7A|nr:non-ribosomal peptide synthetase [Pseudonocardia sp. ICBG162]